MGHDLHATADIAAPAAAVYTILADYRGGHPAILPRPPFEGLEVERGGVGAGTVFCCTVRVLGSQASFRSAVTEPEPGRVLVETDLKTGTVTTFTVEPLSGEARCRVTIATTLRTRGGLLGRLERWVALRTMQPAYARELELLAARATQA